LLLLLHIFSAPCFCSTDHPFNSKAWPLFPASQIGNDPVKFYNVTKAQQIFTGELKIHSNLSVSDYVKGQQKATFCLLLKMADNP